MSDYSPTSNLKAEVKDLFKGEIYDAAKTQTLKANPRWSKLTLSDDLTPDQMIKRIENYWLFLPQ